MEPAVIPAEGGTTETSAFANTSCASGGTEQSPATSGPAATGDPARRWAPTGAQLSAQQAQAMFAHYAEPTRGPNLGAATPSANRTAAPQPPATVAAAPSVISPNPGTASYADCALDGQTTAAAEHGVDANWQAAVAGIQGGGGALPFLSQIQAAFGPEHDLSGVRAHSDGAAALAAEALQAQGYAAGGHVVFGGAPSLHLAAHEAAHVVQQRGGVQLRSGRGQADDVYERHADDVADRVVRGESAADLLRQGPQGGGTQTQAVQCKDDPKDKKDKKDKHHGPPATEAQRRTARQELLAWQSASQTFINNNRAWLSANWIDFIGKTSPNIRLAWSDGQTAEIIGTIFGNFIGDLAEYALKKGTTAILTLIGTEVAPGIGTAVGFVVGVLIDTASSAIYEAITGKSDLDQARADASKQTAAQIQHRLGGFEDQAAKSLAQLSGATRDFMTRIDAPDTDGTEVTKLGEHLKGERKMMHAPPRADRSLLQRMLHDWVLEHAGDEEDANKSTSETQWENARTDVFGKGDSLDNHPEIFAYQTRAHWAELGFDEGARHVPPMISEATRQKKIAKDPAGAVERIYHGQTYTFTHTKKPQAVIKTINDDWWYDTTSMGRQLINNNKFKIDCTLDLTTADGACYVDNWDYHIQLLGPVEPGKKTQGSISVQPD